MQHTIELKPFTVPNFVIEVMRINNRQEGFIEPKSIPLRELSSETLEAMCYEFRIAVFEKAGKVPNNQGEQLPTTEINRSQES